MKLKDWLCVVVFFGVILSLIVMTWVATIPLYRDLPSLIFKNYEVKTGLITDVEREEKESGKSWGLDHVIVDGETYLSEDLSLSAYQEITLYYLKYSKYIVKVQDYQGNMIKKTFSFLRFLIFLLIL